MFKPSKNNDKQTKVEEVNGNAVEVDLTKNVAFGIIKNANGWNVSRIGYDIDTNRAEVLELLPAGLSRDDAEFLFKVSVGKYLMGVN